MKIRNGFVSNSSSSSFIIALKERPKNRAEVKDVFFKERDEEDSFDGEFKVKDAVEDLWIQIKNWIEIYGDQILLKEMENRSYYSVTKKKKSSKKYYFGVDKELFEKFQKAEKEYYKISDEEEKIFDKDSSKEEKIIFKNKWDTAEIEFQSLLDGVRFSDLSYFISHNLSKGNYFFMVIRFSTGGWDYSPLIYVHSWLKNIPYIITGDRYVRIQDWPVKKFC